MLVFLFWEGEQHDKEMPRIKKCLHVIYFWKRKKQTKNPKQGGYTYSSLKIPSF